MIASDKYGDLVRATYTEIPTEPMEGGIGGKDVLRVEFEDQNGETQSHDIPNGGFNVGNPTLQFLAFLDVRPSEMNGTSIDLSGYTAPLVRTGRNEYQLANDVLEIGESKLRDKPWAPIDNNRDDPQNGSQNDDSGGDDGGDGGDDDDITVVNRRDSRGLTVNVD